jgi:hypothetical protein
MLPNSERSLFRNPPDKPLPTCLLPSQRIQSGLRPLNQRLPLNNATLIRLDDSLAQQRRHDLALELLFENFVLFSRQLVFLPVSALMLRQNL